MKTCFTAAVLILIFVAKGFAQPDNALKLWYNKPATDWMTEALPIGNGHMGVMFFGGTGTEQIQFSEGSLWSGGPGSGDSYNFGLRKDAWKYLDDVRQLLKENKFEEAHQLANKQLTGVIHNQGSSSAYGDYGAQQTMGDLFIEVSHSGTPENYRRELDLKKAEGRVSYEIDGAEYTRTYFGSHPRQVMVYRLESSRRTDYSIKYETPHVKTEEEFTGETYFFRGQVADNALEFETFLKIDTDGEVRYEKGVIRVLGAQSLTICHGAATGYVMEYPLYRGADYRSENRNVLQQLSGMDYEALRREHQNDFNKLFSRVELDLGDEHRENLPTDQRLNEYARGVADPGLEELYFQYSRYLMISASRPGTMPMHLQGKWNHSTNPPWACDYHMNINQQMLYWPAEVTNLSESHLPLFAYMESLTAPGRRSAQEFFNTRGWIVNTMNNAFGYTSPGWNFPWGFFPAGAAWLCRHAWEHFEFNRDTAFLRETGYPLMKEAALFWIDYLVEDENGHLVSCPSYSPEHGGISTGASMDHQIAWDILNNCISASEVLSADKAFAEKAASVRNKIFPPTIGRWGQLQEWKEDVDDPANKHRHVSHLYALHPGQQITVEQTPRLAEAAKVSLMARGDGGTGWSLAWKVNFWARLKDGHKAYQLFKRLLRPVATKGTDMMDGGGSYANLLCAHPPFQLDGNMGGCAGIAEMLLQSHTGIIELLPAIPSHWENGHVKGLKARGNFEVDIWWENGKLIQATIKGRKGAASQIKTADGTMKFQIPESGVYTLKKNKQ